jgi:hypothetical protein
LTGIHLFGSFSKIDSEFMAGFEVVIPFISIARQSLKPSPSEFDAKFLPPYSPQGPKE